MTQSLLQPDGQKECYLTGTQCGLERHHCFHGTANRKLAEQWGCWCWIKSDLHDLLHHKDKSLDRRIEQDCQRAFEAKYGHEKFMQIFKKNYL